MAEILLHGVTYEIPESFTLREMRIVERYTDGHAAQEGYELSRSRRPSTSPSLAPSLRPRSMRSRRSWTICRWRTWKESCLRSTRQGRAPQRKAAARAANLRATIPPHLRSRPRRTRPQRLLVPRTWTVFDPSTRCRGTNRAGAHGLRGRDQGGSWRVSSR